MLSILLDFKGPNLCNLTACTSSAHSIGESMWQIRRGDADIMMAGGSEAVICKLGIGGFAAMRALSTRNDSPATASRPYDAKRDGFVMGEGSAVLILEEYEHAKKRGAKIYAEVVGYGLSADAFHITTPSPEGEGGGRAMDAALKDAGISGADLDYVNSHGTSTPAGDVEEARAISKRVDLKRVHVSSTKSMTGHLLGAAGALEGLFSALAIRDGKIPPTMNVETLDPACQETGLNFTLGRAVEKPVRYALSNSFGFGGTNASLVFGRISTSE
jgi:3-oxoacyl-[acyl-carrier-protein] synthase II